MPTLVSSIVSGKRVTVMFDTATTPTVDLELVPPATNGYLIKGMLVDPSAAGVLTVKSGLSGTTSQDKVILKTNLVSGAVVPILGDIAHTEPGCCVKVNTSIAMGNEFTMHLEIL